MRGGQLHVEVVRDRSDLARLRPEWETLLASSGAGIFNSYEWVAPWLARIAPALSPHVLTARSSEGELVGLLALTYETRRVLGRWVRRLAFAGETHVGSDYLEPLARRELAPGVYEALARALQEDPSWDVLDLNDLPEGSPMLEAMRTHLSEEGYAQRVKQRFVCPCETFAPDEPFESFLKRTGRRDNYLRRIKWLKAQPGFRIERAETAEDLPGAMDAFFLLHQLRWQSEGGSQGIRGSTVEAFHREATQLLAERRRVRVYTMKLGEDPVASVYGILHGDRFLYYQSGYDPAWRNRSVGLVLVGETFKDALAEHRLEYDFLRGTEAYKFDWTTQRRNTVALRVLRRSGTGAWLDRTERWSAGSRRVARALLPAPLTERIRRMRRRASRI
jgi:CelD/BcsL family acetyltransferase involved in cellulose biosynthesis